MAVLFLRSLILCTVTVAGLSGALYTLFRLQLRRYQAAVSTDLLESWARHVEKLDPSERLALTPPASVVEAMIELPSPLRLSNRG